MRSISSSALQVAASVVALRLGFASSMGLSGGGSVDSFVRYLSVPGRVSRRNGGVELAPAVRESVGGTPVAGLLCVFALDGLDPLFAVPACNESAPRPTADRQPLGCQPRSGPKRRRGRYLDQPRVVAATASVAGCAIVHRYFRRRPRVLHRTGSRSRPLLVSSSDRRSVRKFGGGVALVAIGTAAAWLVDRVGARDPRRRYSSSLVRWWPGLVRDPSNLGGPAQSRSGSPSSGSGSDSGSRSVSRVLISRSISAGWATPGWRLPPTERMSSTMIVRLISRSPDRFS